MQWQLCFFLVLDHNFYWNSCKIQQSHVQAVSDLSSLMEMNVTSEMLISENEKTCILIRPFSSCLLPLFQNESWCTTFHMEMSLICKTMKTHFHKLFQRLCTRTRGKRQLGNGLMYSFQLSCIMRESHAYGSKRHVQLNFSHMAHKFELEQ